MKQKFKEKWLLIIIILQPIMDILSYFLKESNFSSISLLMRSIILAFIVIITFIKTQNKKKYICIMLPIIIFAIIHSVNSYLNNSYNIFADLKYLICVMQMPIISISLIIYLKEHSFEIENIKRGMVINYIVIFISIIISIILKNYNETYIGYGITGWFNSANTQSMILVALSPIFILYFNNNNSLVRYLLRICLVFVLLYTNGTKACLYCLIALLIVLVYFSIIKKNKNKLIISCAFILLLIGLYGNSIVSDNIDNNKEEAEEYKEVIGKKLLEMGDKYIKHISNPDNLSSDKKQEFNFTDIDYNDNELVLIILNSSYIYKELIEIRGEEKVIEKMKNKITPASLFDNRLRKRINIEIEFENADTFTKLIGIDYSKIDKNKLDIENDLTAIFYYYGYFGIVIYAAYIVYLFILLIKTFLKDKKIIFNEEIVILFFAISLLIIGSEYSGALLRKPNANIYLSLIMVLGYFACQQNIKKKN